MDYSTLMSQLLLVIAVLVALVNIITEVIKKTFEIKSAKTINIIVTILSIVISVLSLTTYWNSKNLTLEWYVFVAFVVVGFMVAYAAMFGYDKLLSYFEHNEVDK